MTIDTNAPMHQQRSLFLIVLGATLLFSCTGAAPPATRAALPVTQPAPATPATPVADPGAFAENPIVYFVITDRFYNGNPANDHSYGRHSDGEQEIGTFHGGDLAGLTRKLKDGYFRDLGVNALWITAPYEQIHGWVVGGSEKFRHYGYHGYYALDYTVLDRNMGTPDELLTFVDTAHAQGIRVVFDVVMNHPGYADLQSLADTGVGVLWPGWQAATVHDYHSFIDYNSFAFTDWWGPDWVRAGLPGYQQGSSYDPLTMQLAYLPDFRTESEKPVGLPRFLAQKADTRARAADGFTVRDYLVTWLSAWVREYGVDGFRCDTVKHVEPATWAALKEASTRALREWKAAHPDKKIDDAPFWMTGEVFPHGVERSAYFDSGFDSIINFDLQGAAKAIAGPDGPDVQALDALYADYAARLGSAPGFDVLSYLSSHDTELFARDRLMAAGTLLLLLPGGVQIFYGDESARPPGPAPDSDPQQATRSSMRWDGADTRVLAHWQKLGTFRRRHVALARGRHERLAAEPYTFARIHEKDRVVVAVTGQGSARETEIFVGQVFAEGRTVRDAYTGAVTRVTGGRVRLTPAGVVLLEVLQ